MPQWIHFIYPQQWFSNTIWCLHGINLVACWSPRFILSPTNFLPLDPIWKLLWYGANNTDKRDIWILVFCQGLLFWFFLSLPKLFDTLSKRTWCEFSETNPLEGQPYFFSPCIPIRFWMFSLLFSIEWDSVLFSSLIIWHSLWKYLLLQCLSHFSLLFSL